MQFLLHIDSHTATLCGTFKRNKVYYVYVENLLYRAYVHETF